MCFHSCCEIVHLVCWLIMIIDYLLFIVPHRVRAHSTYKDIRICSFHHILHHIHTHTHTYTLMTLFVAKLCGPVPGQVSLQLLNCCRKTNSTHQCVDVQCPVFLQEVSSWHSVALPVCRCHHTLLLGNVNCDQVVTCHFTQCACLMCRCHV